MNCETAREMLLDRAYGELAPGPAREVEAHLAECASCRAEAARIEETRGLYRRLGEEPAPGGEGILLAAARQAAGAGGRRRPGLLAWPRLAVGVALVLVVGGVSVKLLSIRRSEDRVPSVEEPRAVPAAPGPGAVAPESKEAPAPIAAAPSRAAPPAPAASRAAGRPPARAAPAPQVEREPMASADRAARAEGAGPSPAGAAAGFARPPPGEAAGAAAPAAEAGPVAAAARAEAPVGKVEGRKAAGQSRPAGGASDAEAFADSLVRDLRRRRDAGELNEAHRELDPCPGGDRIRLAWLDGWGKAWRLSRTGPLPAGMGEGQATRDQYYDGAGRLRVALVEGTGPAGHFRRRIVLDEAGHRLAEDPPEDPWPEGDLVLRGAAAAFWAPQRCGR